MTLVEKPHQKSVVATDLCLFQYETQRRKYDGHNMPYIMIKAQMSAVSMMAKGCNGA